MLQDPQIIRFYQKLTDAMVDLWQRGRRFDEIQHYVEGYIAGLRHGNTVEPYLIHRLEEDIYRFLRDSSNFELNALEPEKDYQY
jgi:hypothetical protein